MEDCVYKSNMEELHTFCRAQIQSPTSTPQAAKLDATVPVRLHYGQAMLYSSSGEKLHSFCNCLPLLMHEHVSVSHGNFWTRDCCSLRSACRLVVQGTAVEL